MAKQTKNAIRLTLHALLAFFWDKISYRQSRKKLALYIILQQLMLLQPRQHSEVPGIMEEKIQVAKFWQGTKQDNFSHFQGNFKTAKTPATPQGSEQNNFQTDSLKAHVMP